MQNSPLMGSLREKGGQHPILEVYYFHISQCVCEPLVPLYMLKWHVFSYHGFNDLKPISS